VNSSIRRFFWVANMKTLLRLSIVIALAFGSFSLMGCQSDFGRGESGFAGGEGGFGETACAPGAHCNGIHTPGGKATVTATADSR
jgi:hypothetical protein